VLPLQTVQQATLMGRILVEDVDVGAQHRGRLEARQILADVGFRLAQHLLQGVIQVHDVVVRIGHHHVGGRHIQRLANAAGRIRPLTGIGKLKAQAGLHPLEGHQHAGEFIVTLRLHHPIEVALAVALQVALGSTQAATEAARQVGARPSGQHAQHHRQRRPGATALRGRPGTGHCRQGGQATQPRKLARNGQMRPGGSQHIQSRHQAHTNPLSFHNPPTLRTPLAEQAIQALSPLHLLP